MKRAIYIGGLIIILVSVIYNFMGSNDVESYRQEIIEAREEQDRFMRFSEESPFQDSDVKFDSLQYFAPNPEFRIVGRFEEPESSEIVSLGTNDGLTEQYLVYGFASFSIDNVPLRLKILENVEEEKYFIPFGDATSANETYGAGRYLDVEHHGGRTIVLDFNTAYNPYCAYVDGYTCPLPPPDNLLAVAIRAGEKSYH
jgi:uncharacterized protein (DUF1684 family)